jgi:hypothetical protein
VVSRFARVGTPAPRFVAQVDGSSGPAPGSRHVFHVGRLLPKTAEIYYLGNPLPGGISGCQAWKSGMPTAPAGAVSERYQLNAEMVPEDFAELTSTHD